MPVLKGVLLSTLLLAVASPYASAMDQLLLRTSSTLAKLDVGTGAVEPVRVTSKHGHGLSDLVDVSVSDETLYAVARSVEFSDGRLALFTIDLGTGDIKEVGSPSGLRAVAAGPNGHLAIARCDRDQCFVETMDSGAAREAGRPVYTVSESIKHIAWSPNGKLLAVELASGNTAIVDGEKGSNVLQVEGKGAAWSPSSAEIAILRRGGKELGIVNISSSSYQRVLSRAFWEARIVGVLSWSPENQLAFNVPTGTTGYDLECGLLELSKRKSRSLPTNQRLCGPWLPSKRQ